MVTTGKNTHEWRELEGASLHRTMNDQPHFLFSGCSFFYFLFVFFFFFMRHKYLWSTSFKALHFRVETATKKEAQKDEHYCPLKIHCQDCRLSRAKYFLFCTAKWSLSVCVNMSIAWWIQFGTQHKFLIGVHSYETQKGPAASFPPLWANLLEISNNKKGDGYGDSAQFAR